MLPQTPLLDWKGRGWVGEEEGKMEGKGREGEVEGGKGKPQVTVETEPLRDLLCHCVTSSQILMLPVNIVFMYTTCFSVS